MAWFYKPTKVVSEFYHLSAIYYENNKISQQTSNKSKTA